VDPRFERKLDADGEPMVAVRAFEARTNGSGTRDE
jgi:hypothetical protein